MQEITFSEIVRAMLKVCPMVAIVTILAFIYLGIALFITLPSTGYAMGAFLYGFVYIASKGYRIKMRSYAEYGNDVAQSRRTLEA